MAGWGATAQAQQAPGTVVGRLTDRQSRQPIEGARVQILGTTLATSTDSAGRYFIAEVPPGVRVIQARAVGYAVSSWLVHLVEGRTAHHDLDLEPRVYELPAVTAVGTAEEDDWRSEAGFEARRRSGTGFFLSRADIENRRAHTLTDLLRGVPGVSSICNYWRCTVEMSRSARFRGCTPEYFLDGFPASLSTGPSFPINQIRGIEIYRSELEVPPQFHTPSQTCGVIAIWSIEPGERLGPRPRPQPADSQPRPPARPGPDT